jgi:hypothetical protein
VVLMSFRLVHIESVDFKYAFDGLRASDEIWWSSLDWCVERFGRQQPPEAKRWAAGNYRIYFASYEDATHFRLRWC